MKRLYSSVSCRYLLMMIALVISVSVSGVGQESERLTPIQRQIAAQKQRLNSDDIEVRRDALMKLGAMKHPEASRAATAAVNDPVPSVRVTALHAITSLPASEAVPLLIPQLKDKLEFVRRETAAALGETRHRSAVQPIIDVLASEKEVSVRAAAVLALGQIGDESAVPALTHLLSGFPPNKKSKNREDEFVMRSAAQALGEIRSRAAVEVLISALTNDQTSMDIRRAAAQALGLIGDPKAIPALQAASTSDDPYLSQAARVALRHLRSAKN